MNLTARSTDLSEKKHNLLIPNKTKLIIVCVVFVASCISGKIPILNEINNKEPVVQTVESAYSPPESSAENRNDIKQIQIGQISIGQKYVLHPTIAPTYKPADTANDIWGVAKKIDTHTYTMQLQADNKMGTAGEIFAALNTYRRQHGSGELKWDNALAGFASARAGYFNQINKLDNHNGFFDYLNNQDGFKKLGFSKVGENSSIGFTLEAVHLIEWVYAGDEEHNSNQLNKDWRYAGVGVNGSSTDFIFAADKM